MLIKDNSISSKREFVSAEKKTHFHEMQAFFFEEETGLRM